MTTCLTSAGWWPSVIIRAVTVSVLLASGSISLKTDF